MKPPPKLLEDGRITWISTIAAGIVLVPEEDW
jgi:hypothetical protein